MPISSITLQPNSDSLNAAYRPIAFKVVATRTDNNPIPPVVYCDIYINSIFYRTIAKTQFESTNSTNSIWFFDIQDATQEVLTKTLGPNSGIDILQIDGIHCTAYCMFRSSGYDTNGFIAHEGTAPIQGTGTSAPVSGTGTQSNIFFVLNTALQHEDNQNLVTHLQAYELGFWDANAYPLSHRGNNYRVSRFASDYFPIFVDNLDPYCIIINYKYKGEITYRQANSCDVCNNVSIVGSPSLPDATVGTPYSYSFNLSGSRPFTPNLNNAPLWMNIGISASTVTFGGTPTPIVKGTLDTCTDGTLDPPFQYAYQVTFKGILVFGSTVTLDNDSDYQTPPVHIHVVSTVLNGWTLNDLANDLVQQVYALNPNTFAYTDASGCPGLRIRGATTSSGSVAIVNADEGVGNVDIDITNCGNTVNFSDTFTVIDNTPPCVAPSIDASVQLPDGTIGVPYVYQFQINGTTPFTLNITASPSWMTATVDTSGVMHFSGTPDTVATTTFGMEVSNDCSVNPLPFSNNFTINPTGTTATLSFRFVRAGQSSWSFSVFLSTPIDANVNVQRMFADGYVDMNACTGVSGGSISSAQFNAHSGDLVILAGNTGTSIGPETTTGDWSQATLSTVNNILVENTAVLDTDTITIGSFTVTISVQKCG
jgi:hypothetical protein